MSQNKIEPYLKKVSDWKTLIKDKHILFDTDAIVSIMKFEAEDILDDFKSQKAVCCYIDPVYIELMNTNSVQLRIKRQELLHTHSFNALPIRLINFDAVQDIQGWLSTFNIFPAPTDLYLAGILDHFVNSGSVILLTSNLSDFPYPLFKRKGYITLQANKNSKILSLLNFDKSLLA